MNTKLLYSSSALALFFASTSHAAVLITPQSSTGTPFASTPWASSLSSTDLVNAGQSTLALATQTASFFGPNGTNDGSGATNTNNSTYVSSGDDLANNFTESGGTWWATFDLDVSSNTLG